MPNGWRLGGGGKVLPNVRQAAVRPCSRMLAQRQWHALPTRIRRGTASTPAARVLTPQGHPWATRRHRRPRDAYRGSRGQWGWGIGESGGWGATRPRHGGPTPWSSAAPPREPAPASGPLKLPVGPASLDSLVAATERHCRMDPALEPAIIHTVNGLDLQSTADSSKPPPCSPPYWPATRRRLLSSKKHLAHTATSVPASWASTYVLPNRARCNSGSVGHLQP